ncbi:MAG: hypothetical protein IPP60_15335 [Sphingobacteriales bacterium]|nr:hypothetical protein [Sphingobacteriales bacterium]
MCVTNGNTKVFYDNGGKLIARIDDDGASPYDLDQLDSTEVCVGIDGSVLTVTDNLGNNQPYLQRKWTIKPKTNTNSTVTLYFTATELAALAFKASQAPGYYTFQDLQDFKFQNIQEVVLHVHLLLQLLVPEVYLVVVRLLLNLFLQYLVRLE